MEDTRRMNRKNLKARLSCIMLIYMDGLTDKKRARLKKYTDARIEHIVNYYANLVNKKERQKLVLPEINEAMINECAATRQTTGKKKKKKNEPLEQP